MRPGQWGWLLVTGLVMTVELPLCGVEALYRAGLRSVGELPRLPRDAHVSRVQRAFWAAQESGPLVVEPLRPAAIVLQVARTVRDHGHAQRLVGESTADVLAKLICFQRMPRVRPLVHARCELSLMIWLTRHASAEQLATGYAERAYLGRGAHGVTEASRIWFDSGAEELTWSHAAMLAALAKEPQGADPRCHAARAAHRRGWVLGRLREQSLISEPEYRRAVEEPLLPTPEPCPPPKPLHDDDGE